MVSALEFVLFDFACDDAGHSSRLVRMRGEPSIPDDHACRREMLNQHDDCNGPIDGAYHQLLYQSMLLFIQADCPS